VFFFFFSILDHIYLPQIDTFYSISDFFSWASIFRGLLNDKSLLYYLQSVPQEHHAGLLLQVAYNQESYLEACKNAQEGQWQWW
jgi:hypothetical protein